MPLLHLRAALYAARRKPYSARSKTHRRILRKGFFGKRALPQHKRPHSPRGLLPQPGIFGFRMDKSSADFEGRISQLPIRYGEDSCGGSDSRSQGGKGRRDNRYDFFGNGFGKDGNLKPVHDALRPGDVEPHDSPRRRQPPRILPPDRLALHDAEGSGKP